MHHDLTSRVFLQPCSGTGGTRVLVSSLNPQWLEPSFTSSPRLCRECHKQSQEQCLAVHELLGGEGSSSVRFLCGLDPALRGTAGPGTAREHSQHCPSFSPSHTVWTNGQVLIGSFWLRDDITDYICVHFRSAPLLREKQFLANSSKCLPPTVWMKTVCSRKMGRCEFLSLWLLGIVFASAKLKMIMLPLKMRWMLRLTWVGGKDFKQDESGDKPSPAKTNSCRDLWKEKGCCCSKRVSHVGLIEAVYPSIYNKNQRLSDEERKCMSCITQEDWRTGIIRTTNWYSIGQ